MRTILVCISNTHREPRPTSKGKAQGGVGKKGSSGSENNKKLMGEFKKKAQVGVKITRSSWGSSTKRLKWE